MNPFQNKPWFLHICSMCLLKTPLEKEKLLIISNFSLSPSVFYPSRELSTIFTKFEIVFCKHFWVWNSLKFVVRERVNTHFVYFWQLHYFYFTEPVFTVDGGFSDWSAWTACPVSCGSGRVFRSRTCTNPEPRYNGANCTGYYESSTSCVLPNCPSK